MSSVSKGKPPSTRATPAQQQLAAARALVKANSSTTLETDQVAPHWLSSRRPTVAEGSSTQDLTLSEMASLYFSQGGSIYSGGGANKSGVASVKEEAGEWRDPPTDIPFLMTQDDGEECEEEPVEDAFGEAPSALAKTVFFSDNPLQKVPTSA